MAICCPDKFSWVKQIGEFLGGITRSRRAGIGRLGALKSRFSAMKAAA